MFLKRFFALLCTIFIVLMTMTGTAAAGPSFQQIMTDNPAVSSWNDGITLTFVLDENKCRKLYGSSWAQDCASPALGNVGSMAKGIAMTPHTQGEWRWISTSSVRFTPATKNGALAPQTKYTIDVSGLALPERVQLSGQKFIYTTQPQAVHIGKERVWIDPSSEGRHGITIPLTFIWPANPEKIEKQITLAPANADSGLRLGEPRFSWSADKSGAVLSVRILNMPFASSRAALSLGGLPAYSMEKNKGRVITPVNANRPATSFNVQGKSDLFSVESMNLYRGHDSNLNSRIELEIKTTLRVDPKEVLSHITLCELPEKNEPGASEATDWTKMPSLAPKDIKNSRPLAPVLLSPPVPSDRLRFAVPMQNGRCLLAYLEEGLSSSSGLPLKYGCARVLKCPSGDAELSFLQPGNILNVSGAGTIALHSIGIDTVNWTVRRIRTPFLGMFAANHGFSTETLDYWEPEDLFDAQVASRSGSIPVACKDEKAAAFPMLSMPKILKDMGKGSGLVLLELRGVRNGEERTYAKRVLLVTDMGLTVKEEADGCRMAFVQNLSTGQPVQDIRVQLLARNGQVLNEAKTDASGSARLESASGYEGEHEPVAVIATKDGDSSSLAWISLKDSSRNLDFGSFAVQGRHSASAGLVASVFSERGMYMPGETLHFGILVRRFDWQPLAKTLPLETVITDPAGRVVQRKPLAGNPHLAEASWKSSETSPTGPYQFDVRVRDKDNNGPILGSCQVRVDEFEPDTLALSASIEPEMHKGWIRTAPGDKVTAKVSLRTLYGEPARQHSVRSHFVVSPARLSFPEFAGYTFYDPTVAAESTDLALPMLSTDNEGRASMDLPVDSVRGTFSGILGIEGFEAAGGRAVTRQIQATFSPLSVVVGYRPVQEANTLDMLQAGTPCALNIVAVDNTLTPVQLDNVVCTVSKRTYVNTLVRDTTGAFRYEATPLDNPLTSKTTTVKAGGSDMALDTATPGDYLLTIRGKNGEMLLTVPYTVAGKTLQVASGNDSIPLQDCNLQLRLEKDKYEPGEEIVLHFNAPYDGSGLITIEREKVVTSAWFSCKAGESVQRITIPASFEGQGYVNVLFMRSSASDAIYLKPHVYAAATFTSGYQRRNMQIAIRAPESVLPGKDLEVQLSAKQSGKVLLFAVDEGILSLTSFATPNPLQELLGNRALDVVTKQALDLLMPDTKQLAGRVPAFGGGMGAGGRFLNPFRRRSEPPFARWLGFVDVSEKPVSVRIPVPSYLSGRIRVMAVGTSEQNLLTAGAAEAGVAVRGSLLIRPLLPLAALPGDTFSGAVTVANTIKGSGKNVPVVVTLKPDAALETTAGQETEFTVSIDENAEATIPFTLACKDKLGSAGVTFTARLKSDKENKTLAEREQSLSIRPPSPLMTTEEKGPVTGKTTVPVTREVYNFNADTTLTVSPAPIAAYRSLAANLREYPFGCTEQLLSRAFPVIAVSNNPDLEKMLLSDPSLSEDKRAERDNETLNAALQQLAVSTDWNGVALWPGGEADDFVTVYAADFLVTMLENGRSVPQDLFNRIKSSVSYIAGREPSSLEDARIKAYACWVLLRSGSVITQDVERLTSWFIQQGGVFGDDVTAALLADCFAILRLSKDAARLMPDKIATDGVFSPGNYMNADTASALYSYIRSLPRWKDADSGYDAMADTLERAFRPSASTTAMALSCRALLGGMQASGQNGSADIRCTEPGAENTASLPASARSIRGMDILSQPLCRKFAVTPHDSADSLLWHLRVTGYDRTAPQNYANGLEIHRRYLNAQGQEVSEAREGDIITVEISVRADRMLSNVAVVDLMPGCFEPLLDQGGIVMPSQVSHNERHEDRWLFFTSADANQILLTYRVRALIAGTFQIPALTAQAMYDPSINAALGGGTIRVMPR